MTEGRGDRKKTARGEERIEKERGGSAPTMVVQHKRRRWDGERRRNGPGKRREVEAFRLSLLLLLLKPSSMQILFLPYTTHMYHTFPPRISTSMHVRLRIFHGRANKCVSIKHVVKGLSGDWSGRRSGPGQTENGRTRPKIGPMKKSRRDACSKPSCKIFYSLGNSSNTTI